MTDWYLFCRLACRGSFAYVGRGPVIEYRLHGGSMSRSFTAEGSARSSIAELEPTIDAVFSLPDVGRRFTHDRLMALRVRSEASAYAWKGQELLRAGRFRESRSYLVEALRRHPAQMVDQLCLLLTILGFVPPGLTRWVGRF